MDEFAPPRSGLLAADDTIFARATGSGRGGVAIVRISGPDAGLLLDGLTMPRPAPRRASLRTLRDAGGETLDHALVLWFPGPNSYTGEDCAELHLHAGPAVIEAVADALQAAGARPAGPGEFTQRAFMKGRVDLIEAEGIADLVEAETDAQRRQAIAQSQGGLSSLYAGWAIDLRRLLALQEALIDFPDEAAGSAGDDGLDGDMARLEASWRTHLREGRRGAALRCGVTVAVTGPPNVGKSSLVNRLADRDVSIVSDRAGTTRDVVETRLLLGGAPVTLFDTAGLRDSEDELEQEGIRRARAAVAQADIALCITCGEVGVAFEAGPDQLRLEVSNKVDILAAPHGTIGVSARTGEGFDALRAALAGMVEELTSRTSLPPLTRTRHRDCIERALHHLGAARTLDVPELRGEELRLALREFGRLTGAVGVEDILSDIFSTFCIGK